MSNILFCNKILKQYSEQIPDFFKQEGVLEGDFNNDLDYLIHKTLIQLNDSLIKSITIPLSITDNFLEFSGLTLGHHIRLTKELGYKNVPLIFIGAIDEKLILKMTSLSYILLTPKVYYFNISKCSLKEVEQSIKDILSQPETDFDSDELLSKIRVEPPANYQSHHSIANEWALLRYYSMLEKDENNHLFIELSDKINRLDYLKTLHYKFSDNLFNRQKINPKKHSLTPELKDMENIKIGIIDDEIKKGWKEFYNYLFVKSRAIPLFFEGDYKTNDKEILLNDLKEWSKRKIHEDKCHLFVIDLRLHDNDFIEKDPDKFLGIQIAKYIKAENPGVQIVISTASNKVWNFQKCLSIGIHKYSVKESPETNNNREETKRELNHFSKNLEDAAKKSYLAQLYFDIKTIKDNFNIKKEEKEFEQKTFAILDQIFDLLLLNDKNDNILNLCLILCFSILENYVKLRSVGEFTKDKETSSGKVFDKHGGIIDVYNSSSEITFAHFDFNYGTHPFQKNNNKTPISVEYFSQIKQMSRKLGLDTSSLVELISVLKYRENIDDKEIIERIIKLRYYRSNVAAHNTGNVDTDTVKNKITEKDILFFISLFKDIFVDN